MERTMNIYDWGYISISRNLQMDSVSRKIYGSHEIRMMHRGIFVFIWRKPCQCLVSFRGGKSFIQLFDNVGPPPSILMGTTGCKFH